MLIVPLVFFSLLTGTASISDPIKLGRVGVKIIGIYLATTALAVYHRAADCGESSTRPPA